MNCKLNGDKLTGEDMAQLALEHGVLTPEALSGLRAANHSTNLFFSAMHAATAKLRFDLFSDGKLKLDTRTFANAAFPHTFDVEFATDKDTLKAGEVVAGVHRVTVLSMTKTEARLMAEQMVAAQGHEPTRCIPID